MVSGHSAGGHLAACMVATDWKALDAGAPADLVPAGYAISGLYDLRRCCTSPPTPTSSSTPPRRGGSRRCSGRSRGPRARRRGRRRRSTEFLRHSKSSPTAGAKGRRDALRGDPRHEPFHGLRSDDRSDQRDDEAPGRTAAQENLEPVAPGEHRRQHRADQHTTTRMASCGTRRARCAPQQRTEQAADRHQPASAASSPRRWR